MSLIVNSRIPSYQKENVTNKLPLLLFIIESTKKKTVLKIISFILILLYYSDLYLRAVILRKAMEKAPIRTARCS